MVKTDFNSFYEEEQYPYSKLLNLIQNSKIPLNKNLPIWFSENKSKGTSLPQDPSLRLKEKLGIPILEKSFISKTIFMQQSSPKIIMTIIWKGNFL